MERIKNIEDAERKVLGDITKCINTIRSIVSKEIDTVHKGVAALLDLRKEVYEDLNQIQHEELILRAARSLSNEDYSGQDLTWYWNPRQTGDSSEPDLRAANGASVILSAEITTSEKPDGVIDSRMRDTLNNLNAMPGRKFYFVRTKEMEARARTKVSKARHQVEVRRI